MQPARFKLHAEERTCNPVQRPNFRGQGTKKEPQKTISPHGLESPAREDRLERNPKVAVLPPMGEGHQPVWVGIGGVKKWARAIGRKKPPSQHSVSPTDDDGIDSAVVDDRKYRQPHPGFGQQEGPRQELPGQGHDHVGTRRRHGEG